MFLPGMPVLVRRISTAPADAVRATRRRAIWPGLGRSTIRFGRRGAAGPASKPVTVTVTPASGPAVSGVLERIDDFNVSLRDASGEYRSWTRTPALKIEKHDP